MKHYSIPHFKVQVSKSPKNNASDVKAETKAYVHVQIKKKIQ